MVWAMMCNSRTKALAAFNMRFVRKDKVVGKKRLDKTAENFDTAAMAEAYKHFCQMEQKIKK